MNNCRVEKCERPTLAKELCNAHYLRQSKGRPLDGPIRLVQKGRHCSVEGCEKKHYGLNGCKKHFKRFIRQATWEVVIALKGGACLNCGDSFPWYVYDLHHRDPSDKSFSLGSGIARLSLEKVLLEAEKCDLVCANCHRSIEYESIR